MNPNQLSPEPQTALSPKPCSNLPSSCGQVHSSIASPASGLAASPFPAAGLGIMQNMTSPGTYIQIPTNAEVRCISTLSLPPAVQRKIYGGACSPPKGSDSSKPSIAIYIYPVNPIKLSEAKRLLPLTHKPLSPDCGAKGVTDSEEKPISPPAQVPNKKTSSRRQDIKINQPAKDAIVTPTPVSVKFCNNLASQVLKTYVKLQGKGGCMDDLMQTYFNNPLEVKSANSFKDNALLLFNGQLFFLAQKGTEIPAAAMKGKPLARESDAQEPSMVEGETGCFEHRIDTGQISTSSSAARREIDPQASKREHETNRKECTAKGGDGLNCPSKPRQNGLEMSQQIVKWLPNSLPASCVRRPMFSENRDLLLKAGIHYDVSVCLHRISLSGNADTSVHRVERPAGSIPQLCKEPERVHLEECPKLSREPELSEIEECLELTGEPELKACPQLSKEVDFGDLEENSDTSKITTSFPSKECPDLSKESGPVVMEECASILKVLKPGELEGCSSISREASPVSLEESQGNFKNNVSVALQEDRGACGTPSSADLREQLEPSVNLSCVGLKDCQAELDEDFHSKDRRKREEVEIEIQSSGWQNSNGDDDKCGPNKRRKLHQEITSETSVNSEREVCGLLNVKRPTNDEAGNSAATSPRCLLILHHQPQVCFYPPEQENPLEVDDTVRDEKINRLKEILKEKQAALDLVRKRVSLSSSASGSTVE
ncbi:uncharacterized protein LOC134344239 [Mobula hypostoma]|uniref:uncharacterized protein LOC134344239 n=1 Tax=Mobula hypostoma TaxID=723540 RepID=UPI002FC33A21